MASWFIRSRSCRQRSSWPGTTLGGADLLRRAMGKKKAEEMAKQREVFVKGCAKVNSIPAGKSQSDF